MLSPQFTRYMKAASQGRILEDGTVLPWDKSRAPTPQELRALVGQHREQKLRQLALFSEKGKSDQDGVIARLNGESNPWEAGGMAPSAPQTVPAKKTPAERPVSDKPKAKPSQKRTPSVLMAKPTAPDPFSPASIFETAHEWSPHSDERDTISWATDFGRLPMPQTGAQGFGTGNVKASDGTWGVVRGSDQKELFKKTNWINLRRQGLIDAKGIGAKTKSERLRNAANFKSDESKKAFRQFVDPVVDFGLKTSPINLFPQFRKAHSNTKEGVSDFVAGTLASLAPNNYAESLTAELATVFDPKESFDNKWRAAFNFVAEVAGSQFGGRAIGGGAKALIGELFDLAAASKRLSPAQAQQVKNLIASVEAAKGKGRGATKYALQKAGVQGQNLVEAMRKFDAAAKNAKAAPVKNNGSSKLGEQAYDYTSGPRQEIEKSRTFLQGENAEFREHGNLYAQSGKGKIEIDRALQRIRGSVFGTGRPDFHTARKLIESIPEKYLNDVSLRVVDDLSEMNNGSTTFAYGYFNPIEEWKFPGGAGIDVPNIRVGVKRLVEDGKSFTEILVHEIGHRMEDFFDEVEVDIIEKAFKKKKARFDSGRTGKKQGKSGLDTHNRLTNKSEWWSEAVQDYERLFTFLKTAKGIEKNRLTRLKLKMKYAAGLVRHHLRMVFDEEFRNTINVYGRVKNRR